MNKEELRKSAEDAYPYTKYGDPEPGESFWLEGFIAGHQSRDEDIQRQAIAFAEWLLYECVPHGDKWHRHAGRKSGTYTTADLYKIFTSQPIIEV